MKKLFRYLVVPLLIILVIVLSKFQEDEITDVVATESNEQIDQIYLKNKLKDGVYQGKGRGFSDDITVEMTVDNGQIVKFEILEHNETEAITKRAMTEIPLEIISSQSTNVDIISSATETSQGIIEAARDCIRQAGGSTRDF